MKRCTTVATLVWRGILKLPISMRDFTREYILPRKYYFRDIYLKFTPNYFKGNTYLLKVVLIY